MRNLVSIILFVKCVLLGVIYAQHKLNDHCQVARSGADGICKFYEECPVVLMEISQNNLLPTKCGFQNRREIICCPLSPTRKPTISPQISNRISAKSKQNANNYTYIHKYLYSSHENLL